MHLHSHLNTAGKIIAAYDGDIPFAIFLKNYFRENKKHGSRDRRLISSLCYGYFRLGHAFPELKSEEKLLAGQFLTSAEDNVFLKNLQPEWNERVHLPLPEKLAGLTGHLQFFPFADEVSDKIDLPALHLSCLIQPDLFLRIRPGKKAKVKQQLETAGIGYKWENESALRLPNSTRVEDFLSLDQDVVIQDLNSQQVLSLFSAVEVNESGRFTAWDCCAASGGKSILLHDQFPLADLTVSDIRESILINLRKRFKTAGINNYRSFTADVSDPGFAMPFRNTKHGFDLVICDAPCSGSGTWSRTPEQLVYFAKKQIDHYSRLQQSISINAANHVKKGGYFLYITCSVYQKENEEVVRYILNETNLQLLEQNYFIGYTSKADTLFAALFQL